MSYLNTTTSAPVDGRRPSARGTARGDDFHILERNGHWSILAGGSYFGQYESAQRALPLAIRVARDAARAGAGTRVILVSEDGSQKVVWSGDQVSSLADITRS